MHWGWLIRQNVHQTLPISRVGLFSAVCAPSLANTATPTPPPHEGACIYNKFLFNAHNQILYQTAPETASEIHFLQGPFLKHNLGQIGKHSIGRTSCLSHSISGLVFEW
jgi:hypothetical protein